MPMLLRCPSWLLGETRNIILKLLQAGLHFERHIAHRLHRRNRQSVEGGKPLDHARCER